MLGNEVRDDKSTSCFRIIWLWETQYRAQFLPRAYDGRHSQSDSKRNFNKARFENERGITKQDTGKEKLILRKVGGDMARRNITRANTNGVGNDETGGTG